MDENLRISNGYLFQLETSNNCPDRHPSHYLVAVLLPLLKNQVQA